MVVEQAKKGKDSSTNSGNKPCPERAIILFRRYFLNREDRVAFKPSWGEEACPAEGGDNLDALLRSHVSGDSVRLRWRTKAGKTGVVDGPQRLGTYSPIPGESRTRFAVVDFDGGGRHGHPLADPLGAALHFYFLCRQLGLAAYLERSGSGTGWHVWVFFTEPIPAALARSLLFALVPTDAKLKDGGIADARSNIGIEVFPKQDKLPKDGIGNMVWLPWWHGAKDGANLFHQVDGDGEIIPFLPDDFDTASEAAVKTALAQFTQPEKGTWKIKAKGGRPSTDMLLKMYLERVQAGSRQGRNRTGFDLACQLRDNRYLYSEAEAVLLEFQASVPQEPHPYTTEEAIASTRSAYGQAAREPWGGASWKNNGHDDRAARSESSPSGAKRTFKVGDLTLIPGHARLTPGGKIQVAVEARRGKELVYPFQLTSAASGRKEPARVLAQLTGVDRDDADKVLISVLACAAEAAAHAPKDDRPTVAQVVAEVMKPALQLVYRTERGVWSEARGAEISRNEFIGSISSSLLEKAAHASDALCGLNGAVSRPDLVRLVETELKVLWGDLMGTLTTAEDADLGRNTEAGRKFRSAMVRLWTALITFEKTTNEGTDFAARASLVSRVRTAATPYLRPGGGGRICAREFWRPVQNAVDAWWRPWESPDGEVLILLAMRWGLADQMRVLLPGVTDEASLTALGVRYGVLDPKPPVSAMLSGGTHRIAVLAIDLTRELLEEPATDPVAGEDTPESDVQ